MNPKTNKKKALVLASVASMIDQFNIPNIEILQSLGYTVDVAADFESPGTITTERANELKKRLADMDVRVIQIGIPRAINPKALFTSYRKIKKLATEENYAIVHCQSPMGGALCRLAFHNVQRKTGKNNGHVRATIIYMAHGFHFYTGAPLKNWILYYPIEKWLSRYTDVLITINKEDFNRAKKCFKAHKTVYVPGIGIDIRKFTGISGSSREAKRQEIGIPLDVKLLISVGELSERKNHKVVIEALNRLNDPKIHYIIVGRGQMGEHLTALDTTKRLHLLGYREDVSELLHCADLFVFPSLQEGLPVAPMEAMAVGLPIICSDIRGSRELIENDAMFDAEDIRNIIEKIIKYLDKDTASREVARNLQTIQKFSKEKVAEKMMAVYSCVTGNIEESC